MSDRRKTPVDDGERHDLLVELIRSTRESLTASLDELKLMLSGLREDRRKCREEHETRIRGVETWQIRIITLSAGVSLLVSAVVAETVVPMVSERVRSAISTPSAKPK